jgi:PAS domain S-box-containing protein
MSSEEPGTHGAAEESFHAGQTRILELVASGAPLPEILTNIVLLMEAQAEGMVCSILLLSADGEHVEHGAAPHLPETYVKAVDGAPIGPRNASCGTAMYLKRQVVVTDVMTDPLWADYRELAQICGLRACWSMPIISAQNEVLGSFAIYREETRGPNADELALAQVATHITGIAIERKRAEEALREREARISVAAESADLALWVVYPRKKTVWMSEKGRIIYGFRPDETLTWDSLIKRAHPDDRAAVRTVFDRACAHLEAFESEHRLVLPFGKTRWVIMRGRCLQDEEGKLSEIIGVSIDVSSQKQSELQLQIQREQLAHLNRVALMGEMTASVAHELNQPLTAILNNAAAARRFFEHGTLDPGLLQQLLQDIISDSQRAAEVIRGVRALVRKDKSPRSLLNLNAIVADTLRLVGSDAVLRECVITTEMDHNLPQVEATPVQIQQVLLNLIMNALDATESMPASGRRITVSTHALTDSAEVNVRDYGVGLPKDRPGKVFDHFYSTKDSGMGMGLTIVRSIIETHGGTISAENMPDGGARFSFQLPAARKDQQSHAA